MKRVEFICAILYIIGTVGCGSNSLPGTSDRTPNLQGTWTMIFSGAAPSQGATPSASSTLIVMFNQNKNQLVGTVTAVNNPSSSCIPTITNSGTTFNVSGSVVHPIEAGSNFNLMINFTSGSSMGTITANGAASDIAANGLFAVAPNMACPGGTFTMSKMS